MIFRRRALLQAGAASLVFPWVPRAFADAPPDPKLVLLMQSNGTWREGFWPKADLSGSQVLESLTKEPALRSRMTVVKGLANRLQGAGNEHDTGFIGWWTGKPSVGTFSDPWGDGPSLDQQLRTKLTFSEPFPTLNCGVLASTAVLFKAHRASCSYTGPKQQVPTQTDVFKLYQTYFPGVAGEAGAEQRLREKRSVLDAVRADLTRLRPRLGSFDRQKLDAHETALRAFEKRLETSVSSVQAELRCRRVDAPEGAMALSLTEENNVPALVTLMFDFIALALSCGLTRVVTFQFGQSGERWFFDWLGIHENSHDDIAHADHGTDPVISAKVKKINLWYAEKVGHLVRAMNAVPSASGTLLDDSVVAWANEMGRGDHQVDDLPLVLFGSAGKKFNTGRLVDQGPQSFLRVGASLLNLYGVPSAGFGVEPDCGPIRGL